MNRSKLKAYAPQARRDFIQAVTDRAAYYGLTAKKIDPVTEEGDVAIIAGKAFPRSVAARRKRLEDRIRRQGFDQVMEAMAYTWFNRLMAIRFMELHGYLDHGYRVLSTTDHTDSTDKKNISSASSVSSVVYTPEIVEHAEHVDLPGLDKNEVIDLKLDGTKEPELYRMLLLAQCRALNRAMPFLFEAVDDETELLLPDNLLHSDSLIRKMVVEIDEEDWQEVEIIGWLYQFYISEKKDEVIGKVVKSEDIPAATQLFTPNWIVKYLVQNSLGRQWVATYPNSPLKGQMEYYIEPAEQTPEVQAQLEEITPESLDPENLTLLDPACGSGHILVEAYDLLKAIYQERGYRRRDIPQKILRYNLFGLEIDERAAQLASFALLMKAQADDRRIFEGDDGPWMNIRCIRSSDGLNAGDIYHALTNVDVGDEPPSGEFAFMDDIKRPLFAQAKKQGATDQAKSFGFTVEDIEHLLSLFRDGAAETFGSLIRVPESLAGKLTAIAERADYVAKSADKYFARDLAGLIAHIAEQTLLLAQKYDAVVMNPPYMGKRGMNGPLKDFASAAFPDAKSDLFAMFIEQGFYFAAPTGRNGLISMHSWMFLSSYQELRERLVQRNTLENLSHFGARAFSSISGEVVQTVAFVALNASVQGYRPSCFDVTSGGEKDKAAALVQRAGLHTHMTQANFAAIPGSPIAYWINAEMLDAFQVGVPLAEVAFPRVGLQTGDNERFLRRWYEVGRDNIQLDAASAEQAKADGRRWFPYNKGGGHRKWYGNNEFVVNWHNDGEEIRSCIPKSVIRNPTCYFQPSITWSDITTSTFAARWCPKGFLFDVKGSSGFPSEDIRLPVLAFMCSRLLVEFMKVLNPTTTFQVGDLSRVPSLFSDIDNGRVSGLATEAITITRKDWDLGETSWGFTTSPLLGQEGTVAESLTRCATHQSACITEMCEIEEEINRIFLRAYSLDGELTSEVPEDEITLYRPDREEDIQQLMSYAIGCMMGRYSLDKPGLIYAHSGNEDFDPSQYKTFPADDDGIIPITDTAWFDDDAANRVVQFISVAWPEEHLQENLTFISESLGPKKDESPRDTIRRYLSLGFFKQHLKMYKKRPIYWLFSSGKAKAFECLVYLHRYNEGTLSRMRTEYVIPLQGKINARIDQLKDDIDAATSTSHGKKLQKERDKLIKQQAELRTFDEKLRHYADQRIALDLDDGVKVNYGKFGDLLAEVKAVTGKKPD